MTNVVCLLSYKATKTRTVRFQQGMVAILRRIREQGMSEVNVFCPPDVSAVFHFVRTEADAHQVGLHLNHPDERQLVSGLEWMADEPGGHLWLHGLAGDEEQRLIS